MDLYETQVMGHVLIKDDLGKVLLDEKNAVHPQNMSRVIARALANESNSYIHRIAFGNGGTSTDAAQTVTYKTPNDGQAPDVHTWDSRLYNETYSEIVNEGSTTLNPDLGTDPGSAGPNTGTRPGGGANPSEDPVSEVHVSGPGVRSNDHGLTSEVEITIVINPSEPTGQFSTDSQYPSENTETSFVFDELGIYTSGSPAIDSNGTADVDVGNATSEDDTGLLANTQYSFKISVDGGLEEEISFTTPTTGGTGAANEITYGDICEALNTGNGYLGHTWNPSWTGSPLLNSAVAISDVSGGAYSSIEGSPTFGYLRFSSNLGGSSSSVVLAPGTVGLDLFEKVNPPAGGIILSSSNGVDAGLQNDPVNPTNERERLLTHLIFSPILKSANRVLTVTYRLTISVARTQ